MHFGFDTRCLVLVDNSLPTHAIRTGDKILAHLGGGALFKPFFKRTEGGPFRPVAQTGFFIAPDTADG